MSFTIIPKKIHSLEDGRLVFTMSRLIQKRAMWRLGITIYSCGGAGYTIEKIGHDYYIVKPLQKYKGEKVFYGK